MNSDQSTESLSSFKRKRGRPKKKSIDFPTFTVVEPKGINAFFQKFYQEHKSRFIVSFIESMKLENLIDKNGQVLKLASNKILLKDVDLLFKKLDEKLFSLNVLEVAENVSKNSQDTEESKAFKIDKISNYYQRIYSKVPKNSKHNISQMINEYKLQQMKPKQLARSYSIAIEKVRKILKKQRDQDKKNINYDHYQSSRITFPMKFLITKKKMIQKFYNSNPHIFHKSVSIQLNELKTHDNSFENIKISTYRSFIIRHLKHRYKKLHYYSNKVNSHQTKQARLAFIRLLFLFAFNQYIIISTDSTCLSSLSNKQYSWARLKERASFSGTRTNKRYHFLVALSFNQVECYSIHEKAHKSNCVAKEYEKMINLLMSRYSKKKLVFLLDNAASLGSQQMAELAKSKKVVFLHNASNSPQIHLIEFLFERIKRNIRRENDFDL